MSIETKLTDKPKRIRQRQGTNVIWPLGAQARYGISAPTRWRWEQNGNLPKRDVRLATKTGWKPSTLDRHEGTAPAAI